MGKSDILHVVVHGPRYITPRLLSPQTEED